MSKSFTQRRPLASTQDRDDRFYKISFKKKKIRLCDKDFQPDSWFEAEFELKPRK